MIFNKIVNPCYSNSRAYFVYFENQLTGTIQRTFIVGGSITAWLVFSLARLELTKKENMLFFVCSESAESILVKLETSCTVILLPPTVSVLCTIGKLVVTIN